MQARRLLFITRLATRHAAAIGFAHSDGMSFNLAYVNDDLSKDLLPGFNANYMRTVYSLGHKRSLA